MPIKDRLAAALRALGKPQPNGSLIGSGQFLSSMAGVPVSEETAMRFTSVQACVRVLSEDIASLPIHVYRRTKDNGKERAREHPLYEILHDQPNPDMTSSSMREAMMVNLLLFGNAYAFVEYDRSGQVKALWPLKSSETSPYRAGNGKIRYRSGTSDLAAEEVLHIPGLSFDGLLGLSPIAYAREAIGLGLAAEQFGSRFFRDGTHLGGIISMQGSMSDEGFERTRKQFAEMYAGLQRAHGVPILEGGATYTPIGIPPEDAQFLETRKYQRADIAAIFRVPLHLIGDLEHATFSNIEHQDLAYLQRTLLPWLVRWEQAIRMRLLSPRERGTILCEHDTSGFLRGDTQSRMEAYSTAIQNGVMSPNEARQRENLNPVPGGDVILLPLNMIPAEDVGKQTDQKQSPKAAPDAAAQKKDASGKRSMPTAIERRDLALQQRSALRKSFLPVFRSAVLAGLSRQQVAVLQRAAEFFSDAKGADATAFKGWIKEWLEASRDGLQQDLDPALRTLAQAVSTTVALETGSAGLSIEETKAQEFLLQYLRSYAIRQTARDKEALLQAVDDHPDDIQQALETHYAHVIETASSTAQDELVRASGAFSLLAYRSCGVRKVRWRTHGDSCPICKRMNGKVVTVETAFVSSGDTVDYDENGQSMQFKVSGTIRHPPLHNGCDCDLSAEWE